MLVFSKLENLEVGEKMIENFLEKEREIPVKDKVDVVVVGGGPAGIGAALASARTGANTMIVEQFGFLGGMWTAGLMNRAAGFKQHGPPDADDKPIPLVKFAVTAKPSEEDLIGGLARELFDRLQKIEGLSMGPRGEGWWGGAPAIDPEKCKIVTDNMMKETKVKVLFHSFVCEPIMEGKVIRGVIVENKSGRQAILAKIVVDCSGDADIAARSGVPYRKGRETDGRLQPVTLMIRIGGVDEEALEKYQAQDPDLGNTNLVNVKHVLSDKELKEKYPLPLTLVAGNKGFYPGEWYLNVTRILGIDGTDVDDLTKAELEGRKQAFILLQFLNEHIPPFRSAYIIQLAPLIGVRETRRIVGEYVLAKEDVLEARKFSDAITRCGAPIDIHNPKGDGSILFALKPGTSYDIPYRCLVPKKVDNLLVAGRCISASHEAMGSFRITMTCMALGQAAGSAAALAVSEGISPRNIDIGSLQKTLTRQGVRLGKDLD
jgi:hypothetical protein